MSSILPDPVQDSEVETLFPEDIIDESIEDPDFLAEFASDFTSPAFYEVQVAASCQCSLLWTH